MAIFVPGIPRVLTADIGGEEPLKRDAQMSMGLVKRNRRDLTKPSLALFFFPGRQQCRSLAVAEPLTRFGVMVFASIKRTIVDDPRATERASKIVLLLLSRIKTVFKTCVHHVIRYRLETRSVPVDSAADVGGYAKSLTEMEGACCIPPLKKGVLTPPQTPPFL